MSAFTSDATKLAPSVPVNFTVTVKNGGSTDAAAFQVVVTYSPKGSSDVTALDPQSVSGLVAGQSTQLTFTQSFSPVADFVFTAFADSADAIVESNEKDNTRTLELSPVDLPNLTFDPEGILLSTCIGGPDANEQFGFGVDNIGTADVTKPFSVAITWFKGGTDSGSFEPDTIPGPLAAGIGYEEDICRLLPGSGSYEVHFFVDSDNVIVESNEDDNTTKVTVNIP